MDTVIEASERFDKEALVRAHERTSSLYCHIRRAGMYTSTVSFAEPSAPSGSVPLKGLKSIGLKDLKIGKTHRGRVLHGRLCVDAFIISSVQTIMEDEDGNAVRLSIDNVGSSASTLGDVQRIYPKGTKVAVKEPYFKRGLDGSVAIRIENPANLEMNPDNVAEDEGLDVEELRNKGNLCFAENDCEGAIRYYSKCIEAGSGSGSGWGSASSCVLLAYSNRAETFLKLRDFEKALDDSKRALAIDPNHLKSLFRKGRALHGLALYERACNILVEAAKINPNHRDIQEALAQSRAFDAQSRLGNHDISGFLLGDAPPQVSDFVGHVEIRKTPDGRGRGLYATRNFDVGDLLLVSNAMAVARGDPGARETAWKFEPGGRMNRTCQEDLVSTVVSHAMASQRVLRQLYRLDHSSSASEPLNVPRIQGFRPNSRANDPSASGAGRELQVDINRIRDIIRRNSFGGAMPSFASKDKRNSDLIQNGGSGFSGLWLLPSFMNHSCLPNASRLNVGDAMFVHASRPIQEGEEITISYFDTLLPLHLRQQMCQCWGFECACNRCRVERSLDPLLEPIVSRFEELHDAALEEINAARTRGESFPADLPRCAEFAELFAELERIIPSFPTKTKPEEVNWIRASFGSAYLAGTMSDEFFPQTLREGIPSGEEIMSAMQSAVPGDVRTLIMVATQLKEAKRWFKPTDSIVLLARNQSKDACRRVYGKQYTNDVLESLLTLHSKYPPFSSTSLVP